MGAAFAVSKKFLKSRTAKKLLRVGRPAKVMKILRSSDFADFRASDLIP